MPWWLAGIVAAFAIATVEYAIIFARGVKRGRPYERKPLPPRKYWLWW